MNKVIGWAFIYVGRAMFSIARIFYIPTFQQMIPSENSIQVLSAIRIENTWYLAGSSVVPIEALKPILANNNILHLTSPQED